MIKKWIWACLAALLVLSACTTGPAPQQLSTISTAASISASGGMGPGEIAPQKPPVPSIPAPFLPPTRVPGAPLLTPTPDAPRQLPPMRLKTKDYMVVAGDTLAIIGQREGISVSDLIKANNLDNPDVLSVGQQLVIPPPTPKPAGPSNKLIPDSDLVNGPLDGYFDVASYVKNTRGYLSSYSEDVDGQPTSGADIIQRVANDYSVSPRLLIAVLEYRSGWLTQSKPRAETLKYPAGWADPYRTGLYHQLAWVANNLNRGYYLWRVNGLGYYVLSDSSYVPLDPTLNAGTVGVQYLMSDFYGYEDWLKAVSDTGFIQTYKELFGEPFDHAFEPMLPAGLKQPVMQLPFEPGASWSFTGGPHAGWDEGSAWAAIDFAPPGEALGCVRSDAWVVAMAPGVIVRSDHGAVVEDLDGDGIMQTGWDILYMHIETRDRVQVGQKVKPGDHIGHASCEGGVSSGTHTHIARRYNGEWIPADGQIPFDLEGWISAGYGSEYDGELRRNGQTVEAWSGRRPENQITR